MLPESFPGKLPQEPHYRLIAVRKKEAIRSDLWYFFTRLWYFRVSVCCDKLIDSERLFISLYGRYRVDIESRIL